MKKIKIVLLVIFIAVLVISIGFYILIESSIPKLKNENLVLNNWDYSKIIDLKSKRERADSFFKIGDFKECEITIKSIVPKNEYELQDLLSLCKVYSKLEQRDSLLKYFDLYVIKRSENSVSLLYSSNRITISEIHEFEKYKDDSNFVSIMNRLSNTISEIESNFDSMLISELKNMLVDDQNSRLDDNNENKDQLNQQKLERLIKEKGLPALSKVGIEGIVSFFAIVQHSNDIFIDKYFLDIEKLANQGEFPKNLLAYLIDRRNMLKGDKQVFGTQLVLKSACSIFTKEMVLWPIVDESNVDNRRYLYNLEPISPAELYVHKR